MSAYQIEAIETGDYSRLPHGTFLRGFVRNYAKVLGIPADSVLSLLPESAPSEKKPGIVVPTYNIRFDPIGERLQSPYVKAATLAVVAVAVAFAALYWWFFIRPTAVARKPSAPVVATTPQQLAAPQQQPGDVPVMAPPPPGAPPAPARAEAKPEAKKVEPPKVVAAETRKTEPAPVVAATPPADGSTLKFRFKGESWVEIRDARGKLLFSRLNAPGSETEVSGKPPFNVIVGNAPEVQLFYNDQQFDLEPHTKVAVARFTVQ
jgi:cytoskeleton protein RodZ